MSHVVLHMQDRRPVWAMPAWVPSRIEDALPAGWRLTVVDEPNDGSGDGAARVAVEALAGVADADVYMGYGIAPEILRAGPGLRWVHSGAAGVGSSLTPELRAADLIFTNSAGIHGPPMAETVLAMILHFGRGLDLAVGNKARRAWSTEPYYVAGAPLRELSRSTVGIVGYGGVGREVARRVAALGARVLAVKRTPPAAHQPLPPVAGAGDLSDRVEVAATSADPGALDRLLEASDVVVLCAPDTPSTRGWITADRLARMRDGALLVNVARGRILDEAALVRELEAGRLRGAGLDVFATEPLPPEHPFWSLPNVLPTPHVSAVTSAFWDRQVDLILHNLECYLAGEDPRARPTPWRNVVDVDAGY